jgi:hypothetical protein
MLINYFRFQNLKGCGNQEQYKEKVLISVIKKSRW